MTISASFQRIPFRSSGARKLAWGAAIVGFAALAAALALISRGRGGPSASALLEARTLVAFTRPDASDPSSSRIVISTGSAERAIGSLDSYSALTFSPNGTTIAALSTATGPGMGARLHLIEVDGGGEKVRTIAAEDSAVAPVWSPDGRMVAVVGAHATIFTAGGEAIVDVPAPPLPGAAVGDHNSGGFGWSADSRYFGAITNGALLVISASGQGTARDLGALEVKGDSPPLFLGWTAPASVYVAIMDGGSPRTWSLDASTAASNMREVTSSEELPVPAGLILASDESPSDAASRVRNGVVIRADPSADGNADIVEVVDSENPGGELYVFVRDRVTGVPFEVKRAPDDTRGGALLDAFVELSK